MAGLLSGLGEFGLDNLEQAEVYEEPAAKEARAKTEEKPAVKVVPEEDFLFAKKYSCPVCSKEFKSMTVKTGKVRLLGTDQDLRPRYDGIDALKYDAILCPNCGYTALSRYFTVIGSAQIKLVREGICKAFKTRPVKDILNYEDAIEHHKLALANAIIKLAKDSEKAYICLKTAWVMRGQGENLDPKSEDYESRKASINQNEEDFLKKALEGFISARQSEGYPMCGMDETTVDFLIAVLSIHFERYEDASKLVSGILASPSANSRTKDKARDLKDEIMEKLKGSR